MKHYYTVQKIGRGFMKARAEYGNIVHEYVAFVGTDVTDEWNADVSATRQTEIRRMIMRLARMRNGKRAGEGVRIL